MQKVYAILKTISLLREQPTLWWKETGQFHGKPMTTTRWLADLSPNVAKGEASMDWNTQHTMEEDLVPLRCPNFLSQ